jgi:hypothetical protein
MRDAPLTTLKGGINRLRTKGGARADNLYDLLNGYINEAGKPVSRPGTRRTATLDQQTKGLCAFDGSLQVFSHQQVVVPAGFTLNILVHPDSLEDGVDYTLTKIHFAQPIMGALYVVAEFSDGDVYHYWLQPGVAWTAETIYDIGDLVHPTTPNGYVYRAERLTAANPAWAAGVPRYDGTTMYDVSVIEPTVYNGFYYVCVLAQGENPRSGEIEPTWPTEEGATVTESADNSDEPAANDGIAENPDPSTTPTTETRDRYDGTYGGYVP